MALKALSLAMLMVAGAAAAPGALVMERVAELHHPATLPELARGDVAPALARVLDLPAPAAETPEATLPTGDIFARPSAMVVLAVDGLAPALAEELELPQLKAVLGRSAAYPLDEVSTRPSLRELLTGTDVFAPSVGDRLEAKYGGKSLVLCASAGTAGAEACAGHDHLAVHDEVEKVAVEGLAPQTLSMDGAFDASSPLYAAFVAQGGALSLEGDVLTVSLRDAVATFDLTSRADRLLLVELEFFAQLPRMLQSSEAADKLADGAPDLLVLASEGLQALAESHGDDSAEYTLGAALLDSAVAHVWGELSGFWEKPMWTLVLQDAYDAATLEPAQRTGGARHLLSVQEKRRLQDTPSNVVGGLKNGTTVRIKAFDTEAQTWLIQAFFSLGFALTVFYASNFLFFTDYGNDDAGLYSKYKPNDNFGSSNMR